MARRQGKYAHVTPKLPKLPLVEPERRDIVNAVKQEITAPIDAIPIGQSEALITLFAVMETTFIKIVAIEKQRTGGRRWASEYAKAYQEVRLIKDKLAEWSSNIQVLLDAYTELMVDQMDVEGSEAIRLIGGGSISKHDEPFGQVKDKEMFRLWCIANGYERQLQLWPSTMTALVKERLIRGEPEPDGVEVFAKTIVRLNA